MVEINKKIKNNAIITYALFIINLSFLKSKDPNINNDFVKSHTKSAILIHIGFLINILILIFFNFGKKYSLLGYSISDIFAITIFLFLFLLMIIGIYKAYNKELFHVGKSLNFKNDYKILDITNNGEFSEKDKLTFILSLVPFVGYIIFPQFKENKILNNNIKLNFLVTFFIILLYISGNTDSANILFLLYIIFIVFYGIYMFIKNEVIHINVSYIPNTNKINIVLKSLKIYLKNYFKNSKDFKDFSTIYKEQLELNKTNFEEKTEILKKLENFKLNKYLIYIPILNLIAIFNLNSKHKIHIINGIIISLMTILILVLGFFHIIDYNYLLLLLFPIFFGIGYLKAGFLNYELPFLYPIVNSFINTKEKVKKVIKKTKEIKNKTVENNLKVKV